MTDTRSKYRRPAPPTRTDGAQPERSRRRVSEVLELDRDCDLGNLGERAVVTVVDGRHMTLVFPYRVAERREVRTGVDYAYLREV